MQSGPVRPGPVRWAGLSLPGQEPRELSGPAESGLPEQWAQASELRVLQEPLLERPAQE